MAKVFIYFDDRATKQMLVEICEIEGHEIVGVVETVEDALAFLRSSLLPVVAILERDHSSCHPETPLFPTIRQYPHNYGHHRYIAIHCWNLSEEEQALLDELGVIVFQCPFEAQALADAVAMSAALLPE